MDQFFILYSKYDFALTSLKLCSKPPGIIQYYLELNSSINPSQSREFFVQLDGNESLKIRIIS
ncbi:hypothetical protein AXF35_02790 [Legionella pneumophila subsp. pascullei]|nr:hypothetical protein AXF35_02790 [Legionella pneumophila subsp. pascullei]AMP91590.1 hypothetical protein AXF36_02775 [Legionella pneumophila subsp. pascullei]AMP94576.1 hypothetical protein AXF37_02780 [Legionella pneumophila subsp. pascullei]